MSTPIERAAEAMHAVSNSDPWERQHEYVRQEFRDDARAAFESIDVDELARVIERHDEVYDSDCGVYSGCGCGWDNGTEDHNGGYPEHVAQAVRNYLTGDESDE